MNILLSIIGSLPASDSPKGKLNSLDVRKTLRFAVVASVAYAGVAIIEKLLHDMLGWGIPEGITTQIVVIAAPLLDLLRRKYTSGIQ